MSIRTLVVGGAGFVGSHICDRLLSDGNEVVCVDNLVTGRLANVDHLLGHQQFQLVEHDIIEPLPLFPRIDRIYHLASPASPPAYQRWPLETLRVNSEGTRRLLELAERHEARFLFASTSEIYGDPLVHPQYEGYHGNVSTVGPRSMYDEAKRYGEAYTIAAREALGVDVRIVRIFNTYGPRMDPADGRVVSNFIVQSLRGEPLTIYGDGSQTRSFQYVDDLVEGMIRLMESSFGEPVNIGNPTELTVLQFATLIRRMTKTTSSIVHHPLPGDDPKQRRPDISLAKAVLDWEPRVPVEVGIARTIEAFRTELFGALQRSEVVYGMPALSISRPRDRGRRSLQPMAKSGD